MVEEEQYRTIQESRPVIFLSFANMKGETDKKYDAALIGKGMKKEQIRHYGFAFEEKQVLIGQDHT